MKVIVVAGIGTGVGKTLVSSILVEALEADYWKPIQAGDLEQSDTLKVKSLISNKKSFFHPEAYRLNTPMSPHAAAKIDGIEIDLKKLSLPQTNNALVVELAGGLMVPVNSKELNIDLLKKWQATVILVSQNYLGSINHTLLSLEVMKHHNILISGIIFNGEENKSSEDFILNYSNVKQLGKIPLLNIQTKEEIKKTASTLILPLRSV
jgi:dethiobiotin synthetase